MSEHSKNIVVSKHDAAPGSFYSYTSGFLLSLILTLLAYSFVDLHNSTHHLFTKTVITGIIIVAAIIQLGIQLICFLHLNHESKPRWNLAVSGFAVIVIIILVGGSLWIMHNLNYRMTPSQMNQYLQQQDGL